MAEYVPLRLGAAYHGNRMPHHAREDLRDMMHNGMDLAVHMLSHTDWVRHINKIKEIVDISTELGLESWMDNWGLGGPPGDISYFLALHPEAHQYYSNGEIDPVRVCLNSEAFRQWMREWIDAVEFTGARTIFWDEPQLPLLRKQGDEYSGVYSCACPHCRELFRAKYGHEMPATIDDEAREFRLDTLRDYFVSLTAYSAQKGIRNAVCVMPGELGQFGIGIDTLDTICGIDTLDNIGTDPYWVGVTQARDITPYEYVYTRTRRALDTARRFGKGHNIWIQSYGNPRGREEEIVEAAEAAYDAGARTIIAWSYYGGESNNYAAANPEKTWIATCDAFRRLREMERDRVLAERRKLITE